MTDIDDKIIKRARQDYLYNQYCSKVKEIPQISSDVTMAIDFYVQETLKTTDLEKRGVREKTLEKIKTVIENVEGDIKKNTSNVNEQRATLLAGSKDILYEWLDSHVPPETIFENEIFGVFAKYWEKEYFKDMEALGVLAPDVLTRVSEYVPEIVAYIEKIIQNGYAYESSGSVYFDVQKFKNSPDHQYAKLVPEAVGDAKALQEGEGKNNITLIH